MKISECKNAPQWLIDAKTENANVEIDDSGYVTWYGGTWCGGTWCGGTWCDGTWRGGTWRGESLKKNLLTVYGLHWPITISPTGMQIGCERHAHAEWAAFDDAQIASMDRAALKFWRAHKDALLQLCATRAGKAPQ